MDTSTEMRQRADLRDYLAAERTFLAWIRTGLALMGFGFVVARFGLFLEQLRLIDQASSAPSYGISLWFGTALIAVGVLVNLSSAWRHVRLVRELDRGEPACSRSLTQAVATALFLALVGLAMAIYLVSVRSSANLQSENSGEVSMAMASSKEAPTGDKGIIHRPSNHSVEQTVEKLKNILQSNGVTLFALVELEVLRITSAPPAAARLFPSRTISSAPRSRISLSLSGECETAMVSKPAAFAYCTARCPSPPIPSTATRSCGWGSAQRSPL